MGMDIEGYNCAATRTKPAATNKYAKRVGAKKAKDLSWMTAASILSLGKTPLCTERWQLGAMILHKIDQTSPSAAKSYVANSPSQTSTASRS